MLSKASKQNSAICVSVIDEIVHNAVTNFQLVSGFPGSR